MPLIGSRRDLPTFPEMVAGALEDLNDAAGWLRSDWRPGAGPSKEQAAAKTEALIHLGQAIAALERAAW